MTKQQLIRLILDAAATGKLEDAEKAIDDYKSELPMFSNPQSLRGLVSKSYYDGENKEFNLLNNSQ